MIKKFYVCGVDYQEHFNNTEVSTFPTIESLKKNKACWPQCGIVEIEIETVQEKLAIKWIEPQNLLRKKIETCSDCKHTLENHEQIGWTCDCRKCPWKPRNTEQMDSSP